MTPFRFEHEFRAADPATIFATYFNPDHLVDQDKMVEIAHREVLKVEDTPTHLARTSKVQPARQLPGFIRPFVSGDLSFHEVITWHRGEDRIVYDIQPS